MNSNYFRTLMICVIASVGILATSTVMRWSPWLAMGCGVAPLVYYHLFYLRPRAKAGLSQSAIDSVYYFGFLVTVFALSISAVSVAMKGAAENVNLVIYQFGVGLLATGYAVIARMHLCSFAEVDNATPDAVLDRYMKRSMDFVNTLEDASVRMSAFSQTLLTKTQEISDSALTTAETALRDVARVFSDEMKSSLALTRDGLLEIRGLVADASFISEREELLRSIQATIDGAAALNIALDQFAEKSRGGAAATQLSIAQSARLEGALQQLSAKVEELGGENGAIGDTVVSMKSASDAMASGATSMGHAVGQIAVMADTLGSAGLTFEKMRAIAKKAHTQLDSLASVTERLDAALMKISISAESSQSLAQGFERVAEVLPTLAVSAGALTVHLDKASEISSALKLVAESIEIAANHAKQLTASVTESSKGVEGVGKLLEGANDLQTTVSSLQAVVNTLANTVQATQRALSESSSGLQSSIAMSTAALEDDVKRSSQAATLLTEQLIKVAQSIIDRTQEHRGGLL